MPAKELIGNPARTVPRRPGSAVSHRHHATCALPNVCPIPTRRASSTNQREDCRIKEHAATMLTR